MSANHRKKAAYWCDSVLLDEYLNFLRVHRGLSNSTIGIRANFVAPFLDALGLKGTPATGISASRVHDYVIKTAGAMTRPARKHLVSSLRSFLRYCHVRGYTERDLAEAVPVIRTHKLDRVPRAIPWESVQKLLAAPDRSTHEGRREYAILQLLATYGVRIGQVTPLKFQDIDWHGRLIRFPSSKKGRNLCFPLTHDVAEALLAYIRKSRGNAPFPEVFLTVRGKTRPLAENNHLNWAIERCYRRAGVESVTKGSHAIRHAFATRLMGQDVPLKTIADLLGHKSIGSTAVYTKVDLERLRTVACEWPEVER